MPGFTYTVQQTSPGVFTNCCCPPACCLRIENITVIPNPVVSGSSFVVGVDFVNCGLQAHLDGTASLTNLPGGVNFPGGATVTWPGLSPGNSVRKTFSGTSNGIAASNQVAIITAAANCSTITGGPVVTANAPITFVNAAPPPPPPPPPFTSTLYFLDNFNGAGGDLVTTHTSDSGATYSRFIFNSSNAGTQLNLVGDGTIVQAELYKDSNISPVVLIPSSYFYVEIEAIFTDNGEGYSAGAVALFGRCTNTTGSGNGIITGPNGTYDKVSWNGRLLNFNGAGISSAASPLIGTHVLRMEFSGTTVKLYVDGVLYGTQISTVTGIATGTGGYVAFGASASSVLNGWFITRAQAGSLRPPPTITNGPPPGGTVAVAYSFSYTSTNAPAFNVTAGALPTGLSLSAAGVISGTPTTVGTFTGTVTASNGIAPDATQSFNIPIGSPPPSSSTNITAPISNFAIPATNLLWFDAQFNAPVNLLFRTGGNQDTVIFVYNQYGSLIATNDDYQGLTSYLLLNALPVGHYYMGVALYPVTVGAQNFAVTANGGAFASGATVSISF